jgi:putative transcriptional regulator
MELGAVIRQIRLELGLSQEGLARELLVGFTSVNRWENGRAKPNPIARHALLLLCRNKNISPELIELLEKSK